MLLDDIRSIKSSAKDLKKFGLTVGIVFLLIGFLWLWKSKGGYVYFIFTGAFFIVFAFLAPLVLKPIQKIWMTAALAMGWVMTRVLLSIVFYLVMTPIGLIAKLMGKKFLDPALQADADSYWVIRRPLDRKKEDYEKQY